MIEIEFLSDESGNKQVIDLITSIANRAMNDDDYAELAARIAQLLDYMKEIGVPPIEKRTLYGISSIGNPITLVDVVKELNNHPPLMEARANWRPVGAFRAIFFYEIAIKVTNPSTSQKLSSNMRPIHENLKMQLVQVKK